MSIKQSAIALSILLTFAGFVLTAQLLGVWQTESSKVPITIHSGDFAGAYDPGDIRGSYSFQDVENAFQVPVEELATAFHIPDTYDQAAFQNKMLEEVYDFGEELEIGNGSVKLFVAFYTGLPYDFESAGDSLPNTAVDLLKSRQSLSDAQLEYLSTHTIDILELESSAQDPENAGTQTTTHSPSTEEEPASDVLQIKGKTLFKEVLDAGLSQAEIESVLTIEMGSPLMEIRAFCAENNLEFSRVKAELQARLEAK